MAPLATLLLVFTILVFFFRDRVSVSGAGRIALASMLVLTGVAHFTRTEALAAMVPPLFAEPFLLIYVTGIVELLFAGLLLVRGKPIVGWALTLLLLSMLPANVYSAIARVGLGGHGPTYLWLRVPLQIFFIFWALACTGALRWQQPEGRGSWRSVFSSRGLGKCLRRS